MSEYYVMIKGKMVSVGDELSELQHQINCLCKALGSATDKDTFVTAIDWKEGPTAGTIVITYMDENNNPVQSDPITLDSCCPSSNPEGDSDPTTWTQNPDGNLVVHTDADGNILGVSIGGNTFTIKDCCPITVPLPDTLDCDDPDAILAYLVALDPQPPVGSNAVCGGNLFTVYDSDGDGVADSWIATCCKASELPPVVKVTGTDGDSDNATFTHATNNGDFEATIGYFENDGTTPYSCTTGTKVYTLTDGAGYEYIAEFNYGDNPATATPISDTGSKPWADVATWMNVTGSGTATETLSFLKLNWWCASGNGDNGVELTLSVVLTGDCNDQSTGTSDPSSVILGKNCWQVDSIVSYTDAQSLASNAYTAYANGVDNTGIYTALEYTDSNTFTFESRQNGGAWSSQAPSSTGHILGFQPSNSGITEFRGVRGPSKCFSVASAGMTEFYQRIPDGSGNPQSYARAWVGPFDPKTCELTIATIVTQRDTPSDNVDASGANLTITGPTTASLVHPHAAQFQTIVPHVITMNLGLHRADFRYTTVGGEEAIIYWDFCIVEF